MASPPRISSVTFQLRTDRLAEHVDVAPGGEIRLNGSYHSTFDGSEIDAATTTWPDGTPGGGSVDAGGFIDLKAGGFHVTSRDPKTHEVSAVATGDPAPLCEQLGVSAPCLPLRLLPHSQTRLITMDQWRSSLKGAITVEIMVPPPPPAYAPAVDLMSHPATLGALGGLGLVALVGVAWVVRRRQRLSPTGQLREIADRLQRKLEGADPALRATVAPVVERTRDKIRRREVDPSSREGERVRDLLLRAEGYLEATAADARAASEQAAVDELAAEMEAALEAAREAERAVGPPR